MFYSFLISVFYITLVLSFFFLYFFFAWRKFIIISVNSNKLKFAKIFSDSHSL